MVAVITNLQTRTVPYFELANRLAGKCFA